MGAAMSITAFPVLARILDERSLSNTRPGMIALVSAAFDDVAGWCILALVVATVRAGQDATAAWMTLIGAVAYVIVMVFVVRPLLRRFTTGNSLAWMILLALTSALVSESIGVHALFGAFLMGAMMPRNTELVRAVRGRIEPLTATALLPLFFAISGLRTTIGLVQGSLWIYAAAIFLVAVAGKLGGATLAARVAGDSWRDAATIGVLMNTRGMMELVILNIGMDIGVISPAIFTMMALMALASTLITCPLLQRFTVSQGRTLTGVPS
jgi:Kef-type K+ transport system membrane component KefB